MTETTTTLLRGGAVRTAAGAADGAVQAGVGRARKQIAFLGPVISESGAGIAAGARRVGSIVVPLLRVVSVLGWVVLGLGLASLLISALGGWLEFAFLGATFVVAVVCASVFVIGRSTYAATIELDPRRVVVGERALGRLAIVNIGSRRNLPSRVEVPVGDARAEFSIPGLAAGEGHEELFAVPTARRAVIVAGPVVAVRGDQLGLLRRAVKCADQVELFVHPATARLAPSAAGLLHDLEGHVTRRLSSADMAFHALRDYVPGDDRRHVHWKATARTGQLMVRQFEETRRSQLTIVLGANSEHYAAEDDFELAVSVAASIASQVIQSGNDTSIVSDAVQLSTRSVTRMLDDSSRLELVGRRYPTPREFARQATLRLPPPTVLIFVVGSQMSIADIRSMHSLFPGDVRSFAFRAESGAASGLSGIPGLSIATIGQLDELRLLVGKLTG